MGAAAVPLRLRVPGRVFFPHGVGGSRAHARAAARAGRPLPGYAAACEPFQRRGPGHAPKGGPSCEREGRPRPRGSPRRCRTVAAGASRLLSPPGPARGSTGGRGERPRSAWPCWAVGGGRARPPPLSLTPRICRTRRRGPRHECVGGARSAPASTRTLRPGGCCSWRRAAALLREPQLREASLSSQGSGGLPLSASGLLGSAGRSALRCLQQALAALAPGARPGLRPLRSVARVACASRPEARQARAPGPALAGGRAGVWTLSRSTHAGKRAPQRGSPSSRNSREECSPVFA